MTVRIGYLIKGLVSGLIASVAIFWGPSVPVAAQVSAGAPVAPSEAPKRITVPPGFRVTLSASEPDVVQPIAMTVDHRGRLWVIENYSYPIWLGGPRGRDRILILEDTDGDGRFESRKIFSEGGTNYTGIALGFGGVWVCATPNLIFIPDRNGDDQPDGAPIIKLDGWSIRAQHNMFNALNWGPDGWLWGCNGILSISAVGKPGTPQDQRTAIDCGVWRYHPTREVFEVVAHGTTNPWGLDFDDYGEAFITNCVIPHLFRVIPGSHFQRMFGNDVTPFVYDLMTSCADHLHWAGGRWQDSRSGQQHGVLGGGHAHVGGMIYLGDNWPETYRNTLFTCNIHGHRVNNDRFDRIDDGYRIVAKHNPDFLLSSDPWFRGLELKYGPDGGVYLTDWSDIGECHENDADGSHRENGRIFKITYGETRPLKVDLSTQSNEELAKLQIHSNEWYVRTARRLLQERVTAGKDVVDAHRVLRDILATHPDDRRKLRAIWALHVTGGLDDKSRLAILGHPSPQVRAWSVRLALDDGAPSASVLTKLEQMAGNHGESAKSEAEANPLVNLNLASGLQRVPMDKRWPMAEALSVVINRTSSRDHMLLTWYGLEPLIPRDRGRAVSLLERCKSPMICQFIARRLVTADLEGGLSALMTSLKKPLGSTDFQREVLTGILEALEGRKRVNMPDDWDSTFSRLTDHVDPEVKAKAAALGLLFGDPKAESAMRLVVDERSASSTARQYALHNLVERRIAGLTPVLFRLLEDPDLRPPAIRALAAYNDPTTPERIISRYKSFTPGERDDVIATLASRPAWAASLLESIRKGTIPRRDVNTTIARQIQAFQVPELTKALEQAWGTLRPTARDKTPLVAKYKTILASRDLPPANLEKGRALFGRMCAQCHRLFGEGGDVGPDITGSDRANPDYILENVLDPSATVGRDYTLTTVATHDGRLVTGILREQTQGALVIQTPSERITLPREDIEAIKGSTTSMMPEGQLEPLTPQEIRDLFAYLASGQPVPRSK